MATLKPTTVLAGRYRLERLLGMGGFGQTWLAADELLETPVALKVRECADAHDRERCLREAQLLARLANTPGIVDIRDLAQDGDYVLLVMEYLEGRDLSAYLTERGPLPLQETISLLRPIAEALETLHAQGLLHRDVSPDNIRVLPDGSACLMDFGSALDTSTGPSPTIAVKPGYAPPEQYSAPESQGPWTDTYALAATAFQCLTGRVPMDALQRLFKDDLPMPSQLGYVGPNVDDVLAQALSVDAQVRTKTPSELMQGLVQALASFSQQTEPPSEQPAQTVLRQANGNQAEHVAPNVSTEATGHVEPPKEPAAQTAGHHASRRRKLPTATIGAVVGAVAVLFVLLVVVLLGPGSSSGSSASSGSSSSVHYTQQNVTAETIAALHRSEGIETVTVEQCTIDAGAIEQLSQLPALENVHFSACELPSLDALADCPTLRIISIDSMADLDGGALFSREFKNVEALWFSTVGFASDLDFLEHFSALENLTLSPVQGIDDLAFLEHVPSLTHLDVSGIDLSGGKDADLALCRNLTNLWVNGCGISDLSWAQQLPGLRFLMARGNQIASIEPLRSCALLGSVHLSSNLLTSLEPLSACGELHCVEVVANQLQDLHGLENQALLEELYADQNVLTSVEALSGCTALKRVSLSHNQLAEASAFKGADGIRQLDISYNQLTNLDFCEPLIRLEQLNASHNQIADISKLASCSKLEGLALQDNRITDIAALGNGFTSLEALDLSSNAIASLEPLAGCSALVSVAVYGNELSSLDGMQDKPNLEHLLADGNHITDISGLAGSTGVLRALDLGNNQVSDLSVLSDLFSQTQFDVGVTLLFDHNQIASMDSLPAGPRYYVLTLWGNPLADVDFLAREGMRWSGAFIPYLEGTDYEALYATQTPPAPLTIVGAPYDQQARLLDEAKGPLFEPKLVSEEEADSQARELRDELHAQVSGAAGASLVDLEQGEA